MARQLLTRHTYGAGRPSVLQPNVNANVEAVTGDALKVLSAADLIPT